MDPTEPAPRKHMNRRQKLVVFLVGIGALLLVARVALPIVVCDQMNRRMADMGPYRGHVEDVDIALWRGAYALNSLVIDRATGKVPVPFVNSPRLELSVSWHDLFRGSVVAEAQFEGLEVNFVDGTGTADTQTGRGVDWRAKLEEIVPISLNEVRIVNGTVSFRNFKSEPPVDLKATDVQATVLNLTNVRDAEGRRVATMEAKAKVLDSAPLETKASFDPFGKLDEFTLDLRVLQIDVRKLNDFAQAYANIDFAHGQGDFVMELDAHDGALKGYMKPLIKDLEIFDWKQDVENQRDNPLRMLWEGVTGALTGIFRNQKKDQFGTRIEIEGRIDQPETSALDAIIGILRNAFVEALTSGYD